MQLKDKLLDPQLLSRCWKNVYQGKSDDVRANSKGMDNISLENFKTKETEYLKEILRSLKKEEYKFGKLKGYPEPKQEPGKYRLVTVATISDRIIHKAILSIINPLIFPYIDTKVSYCGVKENIWRKKSENKTLNTKMAVEKLVFHIRNKNYGIFKSDIKGFYDNIPKRKLFNRIKFISDRYLKDRSLNPMLKDIIFFHLGNPEKFFNDKLKDLLPDKYNGISQGSPLSQLFANIYLTSFDNKMKKKYGDRFIRYIDDFIIICKTKEEAKNAGGYARKILNPLNLSLSTDTNKTYCVDIRKNPVKFLGLKIGKERISSKYNDDEAKKWINNLLDENNSKLYKKKNGWLSLERKVEIMNNKIKGQENFLIPYHPENIFILINKSIDHKKRINKSKFKKLMNLRKEKINSLIDIKDWQSLLN